MDADLAELYGVQTKALNQAVKRNAVRFPEDFIFRVTEIEKTEVITNCDHLERLKFSPLHLPTFRQDHRMNGMGLLLRQVRELIKTTI